MKNAIHFPTLHSSFLNYFSNFAPAKSQIGIHWTAEQNNHGVLDERFSLRSAKPARAVRLRHAPPKRTHIFVGPLLFSVSMVQYSTYRRFASTCRCFASTCRRFASAYGGTARTTGDVRTLKNHWNDSRQTSDSPFSSVN